MGLLDWISRKLTRSKASEPKVSVPLKDQEIDQKEEKLREDLPSYINVDPKEHELVSVIATSIAAGDNPESEFIIKKIKKPNPEFRRVSIIATALAAGNYPESTFVIKKIKKEDN